MTREEMLQEPAYILQELQLKIMWCVSKEFLDTGLSSIDELRNKFHISKKEMRNLMNGDFNGTIEQMVNIIDATGKYLTFELKKKRMKNDSIRTKQIRRG